MKVVIATLGIGGWYPRGVSRLIESIHQHSHGFEIQAWVNTYPPGAPGSVFEKNVDYGPYCAKPFAMLSARTSGADIVILLDAAFYAIRHLQPLVDHICGHGYYLCRNGYKVGEWASDRSLINMGISREEAWRMEEASSYCVGLNFADGRCVELLQRWCGYAGDGSTFPGPHTAIMHDGRNRGFVSVDRNVRGHRHDQSVLSVLAHRLDMHELIDRPKITSYKGYESSETLLVNQGGI